MTIKNIWTEMRIRARIIRKWLLIMSVTGAFMGMAANTLFGNGHWFSSSWWDDVVTGVLIFSALGFFIGIMDYREQKKTRAE